MDANKTADHIIPRRNATTAAVFRRCQLLATKAATRNDVEHSDAARPLRPQCDNEKGGTEVPPFCVASCCTL